MTRCALACLAAALLTAPALAEPTTPCEARGVTVAFAPFHTGPSVQPALGTRLGETLRAEMMGDAPEVEGAAPLTVLWHDAPIETPAEARTRARSMHARPHVLVWGRVLRFGERTLALPRITVVPDNPVIRDGRPCRRIRSEAWQHATHGGIVLPLLESDPAFRSVPIDPDAVDPGRGADGLGRHAVPYGQGLIRLMRGDPVGSRAALARLPGSGVQVGLRIDALLMRAAGMMQSGLDPRPVLAEAAALNPYAVDVARARIVDAARRGATLDEARASMAARAFLFPPTDPLVVALAGAGASDDDLPDAGADTGPGDAGADNGPGDAVADAGPADARPVQAPRPVPPPARPTPRAGLGPAVTPAPAATPDAAPSEPPGAPEPVEAAPIVDAAPGPEPDAAAPPPDPDAGPPPTPVAPPDAGPPELDLGRLW